MVEMDHARAACLVEPKVESLAVELRKHVVEERVEVGEFHRASQRNHQQVRIEALVLLLHAKMAGRHQRLQRSRGHARLRRKPGHNGAVIQGLLSLALHQFNADLHVDVLRPRERGPPRRARQRQASIEMG